MQKEEEIMQAKILAAEKTKVYINFFNKNALKLIKKSIKLSIINQIIAPSDILNELAIRSFTGSRDLPKDNIRANELFRFSEANALTE